MKTVWARLPRPSKQTMAAIKQQQNRIALAHVRLLLAILRTAVVLLLCVATARADDRRDYRNYILRRQQAYQVQGVPTSRLIIGKREIDGYRQRDGSRIWFEKDNVVGVTQ